MTTLTDDFTLHSTVECTEEFIDDLLDEKIQGTDWIYRIIPQSNRTLQYGFIPSEKKVFKILSEFQDTSIKEVSIPPVAYLSCSFE